MSTLARGIFGFIRNTVVRLASVKSARGVSFTLSVVSMASKPLGYLRMLAVAWAFGTSVGMDSFHLASGIVALFAGSVGGAAESAVLPELVRLKNETGDMEACRSVAAFLSSALLLLTALFCLALIVAPGVLVRLFAGGFDDERIRVGAVMLWWLLPYAAVMMYRPLADIWALFTERYTLSCLCSSLFNFVAIPTLFLGIPLVGVYSVALCMSFGHAAIFVLFLVALRGVPLVWRRASLVWSSLRRIGKNLCFTLVLVAASSIFAVVDRYFASRLPTGSVAAISYGIGIIGILSLAASTPMTFFLARISQAAAVSLEESRETVRQTAALVVAYFLPVSAFVAAAARPIVSVLYGWGNFDARSVEMTSVCLAAYSFGFVFSIAASVLYRYAQALQKLGVIVFLTYLLIGVNAYLDWLLVDRWGLWGLALATSVTQLLSFVLYYLVVMRDSLPGFLMRARFFHQLLLLSVCAGIAKWTEACGTLVQLLATALIAVFYFLAAERLNLMPCVPEHWRPTNLAAFLARGAKSYLRQG